ncbi:MAG: riboflavin synthase subunit alpha [Nitrospira bacterium SG8_3]|nr:MAG: riboflavin synthase subunit alpha [Nitrospira bacterium SG8_3]
MFTGLVEGIGDVKEIQRVREDMRLTILPLFDMSDSRQGDSISVNGVCLSITGMQGGAFSMDVSGETLSRSAMGQLKPGDKVNLERALRLGDRLGGHLVSGHVDGVGKILKKEQKERSWLFRVGIDEALTRYTIAKGSIAVEGISLTINDCQDTYFEVNIIPQTAQETTILQKRVGDLVNIETDMIGKYVEKFFQKQGAPKEKERSSRIDEEMLRKHGFGD